MLTSRVVSVDARVLRLLNLQANTEIDYQTYASMLKQVATSARGTSTKMTTEEVELITREFRRARTNAMGVGGRIKLVPIKAKITNINTGNLKRNAAQAAVAEPAQKLLPAAQQDSNLLGGITKSLGSVIQLLTQQNQQIKKDSDENRKNQENARRAGLEVNLEKGFAVAKTAAAALVAPFKSIIDQIINYFVMIFLGRAVVSLLNWFANPENQSKVKSILRFLRDWWPTLMGAYILFGTGFGKVVRKIAGVAVNAVSRLVIITARLAKAILTGKGLKGVAAALGSGGGGAGWKGALVKLGVGALATVGTTMAVNKMMGGGQGEDVSVQVPEAPTNPMLAAAGGGLASLGSLFGNIGSAASQTFAPFTSFFSNGGLAEVMQGLGGVVKGEKGIDKVPAMLSDGEFVMSRGAVQKFGVNALEAMNSAGGGTNIPKVVSGKVFAAGGGYIGDPVLADTKRLSTEDRLKRIESQMQVQRSLASGKGVRTSSGIGFGTTYQGRDSIVVRNAMRKLGAGSGYDAITNPKINVGGREYFAQQRGKDIIYSSNFARGLAGQVDKYGARSKGYSGKGSNIASGYGLKDVDKKNLPKSKIMMGPDGPYVAYLSFKGGEPTYQRPTQRKKGMLESLTDFFDPKGAKGRQETLNARTMRMTAIGDLEDMRRRGMKEENIKKMMSERLGPNGYSRAVNDLKAKRSRFNKETSQRNLDRLTWGNVGPDMMPKRFAEENRVRKEEYNRRGGDWGGMGRFFQQLGGDAKTLSRIGMADRASEVKAKQAGAASIGRYYSSSDGKYYKDYAAADAARKARQARLAKSSPNRKPITPTPPPAPKVIRTRSQVAGAAMNGGRSSGGARPSVPQFSSSSGSNRQVRNILNIRGK